MTELQIVCFGEFQVSLGGTPLTLFQTDKNRALLPYLALESRVHLRTELAQLLWPGYGDESARNSLRQALHHLRQKLGEAAGAVPWFLLTRQTIQINPDAPIRVDVLTFRHLLATCAGHVHRDLITCAPCLARLRQAADLYRGDFLAGFTVADSDPFEEWRRITQEQLHIQMIDALTQLAAAAEAAGDDTQALQVAQRLLTLEPWQEAAHRQIMRLLAQRGQRAAALAQYQRCRQVLAEELGAEPDAETTALYAQIRSSQLPASRATEPLPALPLPRPAPPPERIKVAATLAQLPPFLGRTDELAQMTTLLAQPTCRLVTLVGPPGVGKTRLAQEILDFRSWKDLKFEQGIHFVDLAVLRDPTLLATTIAHALSLSAPALQLTGERLTEQLRDQALLLVLDNFEQVLPGAALLRQLLAHCPRLKLLVTSRVPLHLPDEQVMTVQPLSLPDLTAPRGRPSQGAVTLAMVADNGAVQLFCQRAAAVAPGFVLTERLVPVVVEICRRLDGLPLAIELAAARCRLLPPPALLERLTQDLPARLELLTSRSPTLPERQQTLRAAIAWSYDLLTADEQRLFRQMAVFVGGASLSALEAVIRIENAAGESQHPPHSLLDDVEALLDKSLLRQQESTAHQPEGELRLLMLETLREYGWELLTATAEGRSTQQRHADYFLTLAESVAPKLHGPEQVVWLDRLALDHDNLRAALDWLAQAGAVPQALRLATALRYFWRVRGHYREGGERLRQILARPEAAPTASPGDSMLATVRARALNAAGYLQWVQGNTVIAENLLQEALTLGRAVPDAAATAFALRYLGLAADARQGSSMARQLLEESLALYRTLDTPNETALALMYLGDIAFGQQAYGEAEQLYQESADLLRRLGNNVVLPYALRHLGYLALVRGDLPTALALSTESLRLNLAAGEQQGSAAALTALAAVAVAGEQWGPATRLLAAVDAWLTTSRAQLLPIDRTYYEQTQKRLQQHRPVNPPDALVAEAAPLALVQALAYVQEELTLADEPGRQGDKVTSDKVTSRPGGTSSVTLSPPHLVTLSPPHLVTPPHNLPPSPSPLVGRDQALAEIDVLLQRPETRLVTLVGPGGMGKTRLAVEVGRQQLPRFRDGVWFVALASIGTTDALPGAIATALGITLQGSEPRQALLQSLSAQHLLLLLDNYEHLLLEEAAVDLVVDLLARAPSVQILITSRQRLNLREEQLYPVQALTIPSTVTLAEAAAASAVRLFVQAVQRVQADFQLTTTNLPAVLRICQLVQGMPLGLELAAANAGGAPLRAIADALEQSAEILAVEWRDLPARQRSMRAVFAWSWQLLSAAEQRILRQSARFRGGFDYTAAQAVIGATPALLTALVNKSLLQWQAGAPGEGRYAMHELLRQFAAEALAESDERTVVEERHGRYYLAYLAARGFRLGRGEPKEASAEIQVELDNVRLAWHWAATQGGLAELDQALYAWWQFCLLQGLGGEAQQSLAAALAGVRTLLTHGADDAPLRLLGTRLLAKLLALHANYLFAQGRDAEMAAQAREAMQLGANSGGFEGEILGSYVLGRVLQDAEQKREAQALWEQTIQLIQRYHPQHPENELLHELHWMAHIMLRGSALHFGDYAGCRAHIVEALRICQTLGKQRGELTSLSCLGEINFFLYDFAAAEADYRAELALGRSLGYRLSEMSAQEGLARVARLRGDYATARTLFEQSLSTATELAFHYDESHFLAALIRLHCQLGNQTAAAACQERLTQLLAQVPLGKECRLYGYLAAAFKAHYAGDKAEALAAAEAANQINQQGGDILFRLVDTALILGHVRAAAGHWAAAQSAFQEALTAFQQFNNQALAAEPQAGLAQIALAQGDRVGALAQIEALLPVLAQEPHAGYNDPFFIYLTGYRVLVANGDPRAASLLQQGYALLHQDAAALDDESRQRFLAVPLHRDLIAAYTEMQAHKDKETRRQGDKEQASSEPSFSLSPLLVPLSSVTPLHNLPAELTPFVGRTRSIAEILNRLQQGVRLLTLIGPGGMGKTRLGLAVGQKILDLRGSPLDAILDSTNEVGTADDPKSKIQNLKFPDGVWFVALAALTNPAAIATAIATALRLPITGNDARTALAQLLQPKRLLLILDNFEQLLVGSSEGAELVAALLQAAPGVQMLITSRERLQLRSEQLYQVPPLSVAPNATLAEATAASAARLFVQSAQFVQADFQLTPTNLAAVLRICDLVQGIPLGLELAAAQVGTLSLDAIADAIEQSAEFLAVDWVDLPARQRSMRAVFAWSWQLLNAAEQRALRQLSIFRGGFTREAAQAITSVTQPTLTRLVHCSLLHWREQAAGGRYAIHELLRQFATEELARVTTEQEEIAARHSEFYLNYLAAREMRLTRTEPRAAAAEIQAELDNIRQAWQGATQRLAFSALQRSAWALFSFYRHTGSSSEALQTFQALAEQILLPAQSGFALSRRPPHDPPQSRLVAIYAYLLTLQSKLDQAIVVAQGALTLAQVEEATDAAALSQLSWGQALRLQGRLAEAQPHLEQTLHLARLVTDPTVKSELIYDVECLAGNALGALASDGGIYQQARAHFEQSLHLAQSLGKRRLEINSLLNLANLARMAGEYPAARQGYEDALRLTREVGYRWGEGISQYELGHVLRRQGEYSQAAALLKNVLLIFQEIGEHFRKGSVLIALGQLYAYLGDVTAAEEWLTRYQQFIDQTQVREATIHYLHACTALAFHREDLVQALAYATEGWQIGQTQGLPDIQAYGLIGMGHAQQQLGQWAEANSAYQQAFELYTTLQRPDLAAEAQAGLATLAHRQGDLARALGLVEAVLAQLAAQPISGQDEPFFLYLTCYQVLAAAQDRRAPTILQQGYQLLQRYADQITEEQLRQSFLEKVPVHRALQQAYAETRDKETRRQGDKEQASAEPSISLSPPLLVSPSPLLDWAEMPVVDFFVERRVEVAQLTEWLTPTTVGSVSAQLISILGMGGMGKTTLAAAVTKAVAPEFAVVIWRSLLNAPPLSELLRNWLQALSRQTLTALPESLDDQLRLLLTYLQQERCLLVLDNVESIFAIETPAPAESAQPQSRAGVTRAGYEGYDQLFQRLASSDHQSCLLLTSREQPYALLRSGRQAQTTGRLQVLPLTGLDQTAGQVLLASNGLHASATEAARLIENYSGNPLALQIVAATIADFFGGDVAAFQQEEGQLFDGIRMVLDQQFARLSPLERDILVWLAIEREPVTVPMLRSNFVQPRPEGTRTASLLEALQALQNRSLLEKHPAGLTLQNVIIEYTTEYLVERVCQEIMDDKMRGWQGDTVISSSTVTLSPPHLVTLSFLNRFALLKAQAKDYVRNSQRRLIVQPIITHLLERLGRAGFEQRLRTLIGELRRQAQPAPRGYAAGNLLNLLLQAGCAVNELDLSHLAVWQAYLRECMLHNVNFSGADLSGSEFADTFTAITTLTYSRDGKFLVAGTSLGDLRVWLAQTLQPIALLQGHSRLVMGLAFGSAQRQLLASGGEDGALRLWNMAKPEEPSVILYQAPGFIRTVAVSPIADLVASAGDDPDIQLWDMQRRRAVAILRGHSNIVTAVVFSADGRYLASCSGDQTVRLWDLSLIEQSVITQTAEPQPHPPVIEKSHTVYTWSPAAADVWQIAISPDKQWLAGVTLDGMVWRWRIDAELAAKPVQVLQAQGAHQMALTFSPDSAQLAVGALSGAIWLLDSRSGEIVRQIEGHKPLTLTLAFAPDGKTLASSGSDRTLRVWEVPTGRSIQALAGMARAFRAAVFGADGKTIVTSAEDQTIRIWDVSAMPAGEATAPRITGFCRHVLRGHSSGIWTVALDHTCTVVASAGEDANILLWDRNSGQQLHTFAGHLDTVTALAFSPDGRTLISGSPDQTVRLWDYRNFTPLAQLRDDSPSISTHEKSIWSVALSPDGAMLAAGYSDGGIVLWDIRDTQRCRQIGKLGKHEGWVRTLAFSPDGSLLASGSNDQSVRLWEVKTGSLRHLLHGHSDWVMSVAFHPHGRLLASGSFDSTIRLWDVATGKPIAAPAAANVVLPMRHDKGVVAVTFHPAGHLLLSASRDERMTFWHWATQQRLHNLVAPGPYAGLQIAGATGLSAAQKAALRALGAVDETEDDKVTSDKVTSDKVTESPNYPVTPSPSHLVTQSPPLLVSPSPLLDWAEMPVVDFFVERRAEVAQLTAWLTPTTAGGVPAQLISILGMGGMGKTTLAAAVTKAVAPNFAVVIWRSLLNAPPLSELLRNWLQVLSRQTLTALPESLDDQLRLLLTYLQQERCLLVLDNVESIFVADTPTPEGASQPQSRAGVMRPGYEGYDQLLQRLATSDHQSCLLLTSREQPYALLRSGRQAQTTGRLQVLPLAGLDQTAGQVLLASNGLQASAAEAAQLIENYSGNPLALQIVASTIVDFFGGNVAAFQAEDGQIFDGMRLVLDQQFARLSPLERDILLWLAIEREPVTVPLLRSNFIQPRPEAGAPWARTAPLLEALQALQNRSLLEKRDSGLTLQNVIIEYTTEYLVQQVCQEIVEDMVTESPSLPWQGHPVTQSFLNRFALLKAQSKEYTRQSQERLILQPVAAHWRGYWEQRSVRLQVQQMLNELRAKGIRRGYAAGNLLNLLIHLGVELNGYDFSGLSVWQADLRRSTVQNVNLAQADLSSSAFTQTFSRIESVAISPDGQLLAAAGDGGAIRLFRLPNGEPHHLLSGHTNTITAVAFSPDGAYLASTGDDGLILLWTIPDGRLHQQLNAQMPMRVVVFSPDGRLLAGASRNGAVLLWQVENGHLRQTLPLHRQRVNALAFHPSGNLLASAGSDGSIALVEVSKVLPDANGQSAAFAPVDESQQGSLSVRTLVTEPEARFFAATFSPDGKRLVVGGGDGKLHVWDAPFDQRTSQTLAHQSEIRAVTFCADSRFLFSAGNDGVIRLWDSTDMHCCQTLTGHKETVYALALGLQDRLMASGSEDASICLWEVNPQTQSILRHRMAGYPQALECVAWSGCGRWLATGDIHGTVRLWDLHAETPRCTQEIRGKSTVIALTFTPDGQQLAIGRYADPAGIELWTVSADARWQLQSGYRVPTAGIACFSPNGSLLVTTTPGGDIHLWNAQTLQPYAGTSRLSGHSSYVNRVAFSAEGQLVASCSNDLTVRLWQLATGEEILRLPGYGNNTCLALNAQGTLLACSSPGFGIALWHLVDRTAKQPLHSLMGHTNEAFACAFSPDGNHLVSVGLDRSVRLWDVQTGVQRTLLGYHEQYALDVAFSPAGKQVATIGKEGALHLWQIDTYERLHQLHAPGPYAGMNITGVTGISEAQKAALKALGAVEE